jgi:hypothetical protein
MSFLGSQSASTSAVAATVSSVTLFTGASNVYGRIVYNASTGACYLTFGTVSSTSAYTLQIAANTSYVFPDAVYAGAVTAIWPATNGTAYTTQW